MAYKCAHMMMLYRKQQAVQLRKGQLPVRSPRNECQECCGVTSCTDAMGNGHIATEQEPAFVATTRPCTLGPAAVCLLQQPGTD